MLVASGFLDKIGNPCVKIKIAGVYSKTGNESEYDAIIDTGFSGFISMPLIQAFPLGLPLHGTTSVTLADGQEQYKLLAGGRLCVGNRKNFEFGLVILEQTSTDILVGMDFLRTFKLALFVTQLGVSLLDEDDDGVKSFKNTVIKIPKAEDNKKTEEAKPNEKLVAKNSNPGSSSTEQ
jgi:predicted aspartyl protease